LVSASSVVRCKASATGALTGRGRPDVLNAALNPSSRTESTSDAICSATPSTLASSRSAFTDWRTAASPSFASVCARDTASMLRLASVPRTARAA